MRVGLLVHVALWAGTLAAGAGEGAEAIFYSRRESQGKQPGAAELTRALYRIESIRVENHRPAPGATPQLVFSFKHNQRGVSDHGNILNPKVHPSKNVILFTSDHDQERSLFKSNAFMVSTSGQEYLQLSPYRSDGRWGAKAGKTGTVVGRVQGPVDPEGGAIVLIEGVKEAVTTNANGSFTVRNVPAGQNLHLVAWKMSLHDPKVVLRYLDDFNFGASAVTVVPGATVNAIVPLAYRGFGYAGVDNPRNHLEYVSWGPNDSVCAVFGEKVVYQVFPTFQKIRDMGVFTRGIDYHAGRKQWAVITAEQVMIADAQFKPLGAILTNKQLQAWLKDAWSTVGSSGLNNSCIRWSPSGQQVAFEIAGGRGIFVYDFPTKRLHMPAWSQDRSAEYRVGSFSPDGEFIVCTVEYRKELKRPTQLCSVRWAKPQEWHPIATADYIQRAYWTRLDPKAAR